MIQMSADESCAFGSTLLRLQPAQALSRDSTLLVTGGSSQNNPASYGQCLGAGEVRGIQDAEGMCVGWGGGGGKVII